MVVCKKCIVERVYGNICLKRPFKNIQNKGLNGKL